MPVIRLKPGREKPVLGRHPWVFSGAVKSSDSVAPGSIVDVCDADGHFLARGYANPKSQLLAKLLTWDEREVIDAAFWRRRIDACLARRAKLMAEGDGNAWRLIMSEADQIPGLIVDQYGDWLVLQALTAGIDRHLADVTAALTAALKPRGIVERSDDAVRDLEGLPRVTRVLAGEAPPDAGVTVRENGLKFRIDLMEGHKTGFYLDQRQSHALMRTLAAGKKVLDCFCYTGGFTVNAAAGGASSVLSIDASEPALARLADNLAANDFPADGDRFTRQCGNAFEALRTLRDRGQSFDLIVLDPPKFAHSGGQVDKAARGYKDLNLLAFKLLSPGGTLLTYSCSGHVSADLFQKIIFGAALDAGRDAQIVQHLFQAEDHPVLLSFPESLYLKGLMCRTL